ncbi:Transcription initiation factor TFIID subunit 10 [Cercospora beticola]|uniref:Transcription initiation factor TFIID subunit 10 n=1 Tax=Cercospora beticola TaxID=122368 RepID=A0A2G5HAI1_CERBT|nr:Transcription initiation factor TFIID subunit 10 [Cercospora beticola]PIA89232.1 Transcription initiation factor TFIID subunit 10 [Cercospora beticola]WPB02796.1 hypothetical protein RHO25_007432 [Cercospora beticola]CAK1358524.1 unnamed protein product [Cercospora beticola]
MADDSGDAKPDPSASDSTLAGDNTALSADSSNTLSAQSGPTATSHTQSAGDDTAALDATQERDLDAEITSQDAAMNNTTVEDAAPSQPSAPEQANGLKAPEEPRIPIKKDTSLREFMGKMDDYAPLIPDAVTDYYLTLAGLPPPPETDRRLARLLALATQKFIADIAADAYQYSRIRSTNTTSNNPLTGLGGAAGFGLPGGAGDEAAGKGKKDATGKAAPLGGPRAGYGGGGASGGQGRTVLTMEDLGMAVGEYGVNVKRGEFYR